MARRARVDIFAELIDGRSQEERAAIAIRMALRAVATVFEDSSLAKADISVLRAINLAYVHLHSPMTRHLTLPLLSSLKNQDALIEATSVLTRHKQHQGTAARRLSRASSSDGHFPESVLRKAAKDATFRLHASRNKIGPVLLRALNTSVSGLFREQESPLTVATLASSIVPARHLSEFWLATENDCAQLSRGLTIDNLFQRVLWEIVRPKLTDDRNEQQALFWRYWYNGFASGSPFALDLLRDIAIHDSHKDITDDRFMEIERFRLQLLADLPEQVKQNPQTGLFSLIPSSPNDSRTYENALRKVRDDVEVIKRKSRQSNA